jgi:hypothetical protein
MADEPDNVFLRLLREIRTAQQAQGETLDQHTGALARLEKRADVDPYLGVAVTGHERYDALEAQLDKLSDRVQNLESKA